MTATVRDRRTGETHRGRSPETIARRLYGHQAALQQADRPEHVMVVTPNRIDPQTVDVHAEWIIRQES